MTIEHRIDKLILKINANQLFTRGGQICSDIEYWKWTGEPRSFFSEGNNVQIMHLFKIVEREIRRADDSECLTSSNEYVREYKKWSRYAKR